MSTPPVVIRPDWPAHDGVMAAFTTRRGGSSRGSWADFNLGLHTGDDPRSVEVNRNTLLQTLSLPAQPHWMTQVHGNRCLVIGEEGPREVEADAAWTDREDNVLVVMVADCLPILLASRSAPEIAVVHAGWRGLATGVIESAVEKFTNRDLIAWMGPAIGPCHYEVDTPVRNSFESTRGFLPGRDRDHWMLDLYEVARGRLEGAGVRAVLGGGYCTACESDRFYSFRRDGETGRMAALIWME